MAENKFTLNDTQARFKIMESFYEEVTSMMLKRFLLILWYRATGSIPDENSDVLFDVLHHLDLPSTHILRKIFGSQLYTNKRSSTPKTGVEVLKFDLSLSKAFLTGVNGFPSSNSHPISSCSENCILCATSCTSIRLGISTVKQPCNKCNFCSSPSDNCNSDKLRENLSFAGKTRNTGSHSSQSQCSSHPLMSEDIEENIKAITMLYEYLYTDGNWRKFHEKWVNVEQFNEIKRKLQLIKSSPIEELREIFKCRLQSDSEILRRIDNIQENIAKMSTNSTKSSFIMCLQLSVSKTAAQNNAKLDNLLNNARLFLLKSRFSNLIYNVINEAVKNIGINNFEVNMQDLEPTILPGSEEYEQLQVALDINSQDEGVFVDYSNIRKAKSEVLSQEIEESFFRELKNDVHIMDKCEITPKHVILAFKTWKLGSLHVVLSLRKKTKRQFSQQEVDIIMQVINRVIKSRRKLFEAEFGTSVQITTKIIPPKSGIEIFTTNLTVGVLTEENISMDDFASKLQGTTEMLLTKQLQLEDCSKVKAPLAAMLQMTENQIQRLSLLSPAMCDIARMSTVNAYLAHTLQRFMLSVKIAPVLQEQSQGEEFRGDVRRKENINIGPKWNGPGMNMLKTTKHGISVKGKTKEKCKTSFYVYQNMQECIVVNFNDECVSGIKKIEEGNGKGIVRQLQPMRDFHEERIENKLVIKLHKEAVQNSRDIRITLCDSEEETTVFAIKDILSHCSINRNPELSLYTHNSSMLSSEIARIASVDTDKSVIEIVSNGRVMVMTHCEYLAFSRNYVDEYFTKGRFLNDNIQCPPFVEGQKISGFAFKIMTILGEYKHRFAVFTHYNAMENLLFLKLNHLIPRVDEVPDSEHRILIFYPSNNTFVNIRYTETSYESSLRNEFQNGEKDLKLLAAVNRNYLSNGNLKFVNVVAAPNFQKNVDSDVCKDCQLLDASILSSDKRTRNFFYNLLDGKEPNERSQNQYLDMLGQMMCFMSMRNVTLPTLIGGADEKIRTLMLSTQQLSCLYHDSTKKIIIGPYGSGKAILAVQHLHLFYQRLKKESVLYYVLWSDNLLLLNDIKILSKEIQDQAKGCIKVMTIVEIAKEFDICGFPTVSQLLGKILEQHGDVWLIGDEVDGEMFDLKESLSLKEMFETDQRLQNSAVALFMRPLEKRRAVISPKIDVRYKHKYEETGMTVFRLNKVMRLSKNIYNFLSALEKRIAEHSDHDSPEISIESLSVASTPENKRRKADKNPQSLQMEDDFISTIPSGIGDTLYDKNVSSIGHNIEGEKPTLIHPEHKDETEEHVIVLLAIALKHTLFTSFKKRLFLYHTPAQMNMFKKILMLLKHEYFVYGDQTEWKIVRSDNTIVKSLPDVYTILTDINGCRGAEFSECICAIDVNDERVPQLTLEAMSRARSSLTIVSTFNVNSTKENHSPVGNIIRQLLPEYLNEVSVKCLNSSLDTEEPYYTNHAKSILNVNIRSWEYKELLGNARWIKYDNTKLTVPGLTQTIPEYIDLPSKVKDLRCYYTSKTSCTLKWTSEGADNFIVRRKNNISEWDNVGSVGSSRQLYVIDGLMLGEAYTFSVKACNRAGESEDNTISYFHRKASTSIKTAGLFGISPGKILNTLSNLADKGKNIMAEFFTLGYTIVIQTSEQISIIRNPTDKDDP